MSIISKDSVVLKQLNNFNKINLDKVGNDAVKANSKELITLQQDQLRYGKKGGGDMPNYLSSDYAAYKKDKSSYVAPFPKTDLYDTGAFQDSIYLEDGGTFNATDSKTGDLVDKYGDDILDPNKETLEIGRSIVAEDFFKMVHKAINK